MIDADIEFQQSLLRLYKEFDKFGPNQLFGLSKDMSPYYRTVLYQYRRENPGTEHGDVGRLQGLNTGVALFHLQRMRESQEFAEYLHHDNIKKVCDKFHFKGFIGDQVELSLLFVMIFRGKKVSFNSGLVEHCDLGQTRAPLLSGLRL